MVLRWICALALLGSAAGLGGCSGNALFPQLPEVGSLPEKVLSKDEQQGKVAGMIAQGQSHQTEAAKQIEKGK
jgi:hypothetical protein